MCIRRISTALKILLCGIFCITPVLGQDRGLLWEVMQKACSGKSFPRLQTPEKLGVEGAVRFFPFPVNSKSYKEYGPRWLIVPENQCLDSLGVQGQPYVLLMTHTIGPRGGANAYLMTLGGELIRAARMEAVAAGGEEYSSIDLTERSMRADFDAEKTYWLSK